MLQGLLAKAMAIEEIGLCGACISTKASIWTARTRRADSCSIWLSQLQVLAMPKQAKQIMRRRSARSAWFTHAPMSVTIWPRSDSQRMTASRSWGASAGVGDTSSERPRSERQIGHRAEASRA